MVASFGPDKATGLYSPALFLELLEREVARARRYARPLSVILGRPEPGWDEPEEWRHGWMALAREVDFGACLDPERWVMALPETGRAGASVAAERFRRGLQALCNPIDSEFPSLALGVVTHPYHGKSAIALVESADRLAKMAQDAVSVGGLDRVKGLEGA